jgi:hypothetical protein
VRQLFATADASLRARLHGRWSARGAAHCTSKKRAAATVATLSVGVPLAPELCKTLSWLIEAFEGTYPTYKQEAIRNYTDVSKRCSSAEPQRDESAQFTLLVRRCVSISLRRRAGLWLRLRG